MWTEQSFVLFGSEIPLSLSLSLSLLLYTKDTFCTPSAGKAGLPGLHTKAGVGHACGHSIPLPSNLKRILRSVRTWQTTLHDEGQRLAAGAYSTNPLERRLNHRNHRFLPSRIFPSGCVRFLSLALMRCMRLDRVDSSCPQTSWPDTRFQSRGPPKV